MEKRELAQRAGRIANGMPIAKGMRVTGSLIATLAGALVAGLSGSLHCALMCGPLACAGLPTEGGARLRAAGAWHLGRIGAYAVVGAGLGGLGGGVARLMTTSIQPALPWIMAAGLIVTALDLGRWVRPIPGVAGVARGLSRAGARLSPALRATAIGAATPFLPCGLLYGVFLAALAAGSVLGGAGLMVCFALGGAVALGAVQLPALSAWRARPWMRRAVLLIAAAVVIWRATVALHAPDAPPACH